MQTHILIINHQLAFAVSIKQALERTGNFEVHPFTSLEPALDYLRGHRQDVALVDFTLPGVSGSQVVERLRKVQPMLAIIATPSQPESLLQDLNLQGTVNTPISAREIIPVVNKAIEGRRTGRLASDKAAPETFAPARPDEPLQKTPTTPDEQKKQRESRSGLLGKFDEGELLRRVQTRPSKSKPPTDLPEYTSIDNVLSSVSDTQGRAHSEQPGEVKRREPFTDDAVSHSIDDLLENAPQQPSPENEEDAFSALLVDLDSGVEQPQEGSEFDELVKSMRSDEPHQPLPTRHQQFVEFILTGGMDSLLEEIERKKTDELPSLDHEQTISLDVPEQELPVEDMPVLPAIEDEEQDEGTVGDLFTGVSDTGFRNVLTILRGEEVPAEEASQEQVSEQDMREAFPQFFGSTPSDIDDILNEIEADAQREIIQSRDLGYTFDDEPGVNTARMILETTLDESTPIDSFSVSELIRNIERQLPAHRPKVQPLPSWLQADQQRKEDADLFVREPDFLPEVLPEFPPSAPAEPAATLEEFEYEDEYDQTTRLSSAQRLESTPEALETEWLAQEALPEAEAGEEIDPFDFSFDSEPVAEAEAGAIAQETESYTLPYSGEEIGATVAAAPQETSFEAVEEPEETPVVAVEPPQDADLESMAAFETEGLAVVSPAEQGIDDPYLAQLALSLTEVSLELTAEATLLTREGQIVAYAGRMAREEVEELRAAIQGDWDANPEEARIRFINLEGSGKDYMLFSRRTVDDLTLSLIFSGTTPLRDIRRQGKLLIEALQAVPEVIEDTEPETDDELALEPVDDGRARTPYAYVWIIRDPDTQISSSVAQAIVRGMNRQLREDAWRLQEIQAKEEYIYLLAEVPGETPPYEVIRDLKRRSAEIAYSHNPTLDPNTLWADSYLVVTPGRKLDVDEIQEFIQFERML